MTWSGVFPSIAPHLGSIADIFIVFGYIRNFSLYSVKKFPSNVTCIVQLHGNSKLGQNSKKFGVLTKIVLDNLSKLPLTSREIPPKRKRTDNLGKSLKAEPIIDKIVFPVAGPQEGETDKILKVAKATTLTSLQKIWEKILFPAITLGNLTIPISPWPISPLPIEYIVPFLAIRKVPLVLQPHLTIGWINSPPSSFSINLGSNEVIVFPKPNWP